MKVLYDTSVLVATLLVQHSNHAVALPKLELARRGEVKSYLSTHSLAEIYSVITRLPEPLRVSPTEADIAITDLLEYLEFMPLLIKDYQTAIARVRSLQFTGGSIFDTLIAQAGLKAGVDELMTLNPKDFTRLGNEIKGFVRVPG